MRGRNGTSENFRKSPWSSTRFNDKAMAVATALSDRSPDLARRMLEAMRQPFAVRNMDLRRRMLAGQFAVKANRPAACRDAVASLEPYVPWTRQFLALRRECYQSTKDARLMAATRDLEQFLSHEPLPLASGLSDPVP